MTTKYHDEAIEDGKRLKLFPFYQCASGASDVIKGGGEVYQIFKCGKCGAKQTIDVKNAFYEKGKCEECGHITNIVVSGCNYLAIYTAR